MNAVWRTLMDVVVALHYGFLVYLVVGGFVAWRWPKTIGLHVLAAIWALLIVTTHVPCPLTAAQNNFREHAGLQPLSDSFINLYVKGTLYPNGQQTLSQLLVGLVVLISWAGFARRWVDVRRTRVAVR